MTFPSAVGRTGDGMRPIRCILACALLLSATASPGAGQAGPPQQIVVDTAPLRLAGLASRTQLLGTIDLYTLALYTDGPLDPARLASVDAAKALRIEVTYTEDLRRPFPIDWRPELIPALEPQVATHLRGSFAPLRHGDVVEIAYVPVRGTTVRIGRGVAVARAHHDLMLAFLDHWLGERPVSEALKRSLLGRP